MIDALTTGATTNTGTSALTELSEDYDRFITLLTAQIEYQDPLEPMDSSQYVTQLAQLSQVEQSVLTNDNLSALSAQITSLAALAGAELVDQEVTIQSDQLTLTDGTTDALYRLEEGTNSVVADILDASGQLIRSITGLPTDSSELQELTWDGLDNFGNPVPNGDYSVAIRAYDVDDAQLTAVTYRKATVEEVLFTGGTNFYNLSTGEQISGDQILAAG